MQKKLLNIIIFFILLSNLALSQSNNVGIGTLTPDNTALLDLFSTTQGFLNVRLTLNQRTALGSPANSLLIYQTDDSDGFWYWDAPDAVWRKWMALNLSFIVYGNGADGQVAIWGSSGTLTGVNDLFYDYNESELGVGTTTPGEKLDIAGAIRVGNTNTAIAGTIRWTGTDFEGYDGYNWYSFTSSTLTGSGQPGQVTFWDSPSSLSGSNDLFVDVNNFNLGIRTTVPGEKLTVNGGIIVGNTTNALEGNIRWTGSDFQGYLNGQWLSFTSGTLSGRGADGQVTYWESSTFLSGNNNLFFNYNETRLGIGTTSPNETLEINGPITIGMNTRTDPVPGIIPGTIRWSGLDFEGWDGTEWKSFTQSGPFGDGDPTQVAFWLTSRTLSGDDNLWWDVPNQRLGVGTNTPTHDLTVRGALRTGGETTHGKLNLFSEQGGSDFTLGFQANSSSTASMTFTLPPDDGDNLFILASDGNGNLYWGNPFLMLGYYWELIAPANNVLHTIDDWGISRYGNTLTGDTKTQINFGFSSTTGSAYSNVLGGLNNTASASFSTILGGTVNTASGNYTFIPGGSNNTAGGNYSYVFGSGNSVLGNNSTISNGQNLTLSGNYSYAFRGGISSANFTLLDDNTYNIVDSKFYFNPLQKNYDFRLDGDNNNNVLFAKASTARVGLNTDTPIEQLESKGNIRISNTNNVAGKFKIYEAGVLGSEYSSISASSQTATMLYQLPVWHNKRHSGLVNDGTGNLYWASPTEITKILTHIITTITSSYTPTKRDIHIYVNGSGSTPIVITLPPAATVKGKEYYIKKNATTGYTVTIQGASPAETIDGAASVIFSSGTKYESVFIVSNGFKWFIMASFDGNP